MGLRGTGGPRKIGSMWAVYLLGASTALVVVLLLASGGGLRAFFRDLHRISSADRAELDRLVAEELEDEPPARRRSDDSDGRDHGAPRAPRFA